MNESTLRNRIEQLEYEIQGIDKDIDWTRGSLEVATSEAKRYGAKAANGGGLVFSDDHARGMAEMHLRDMERFERELRDLKRRKEDLLWQLEDCKRKLANAGNTGSGGAAYEPRSYSSTGSGRSRSHRSSANIRPVSKERLKETLKTVVIYVLAIAGIVFVGGLANYGVFLGLLLVVVGPVVFAVNASKKWFGLGEPKRAAKIFISYCIGIMLTLAGMTDYNIVSLIMVAGFCYLAALILERMWGAK